MAGNGGLQRRRQQLFHLPQFAAPAQPGSTSGAPALPPPPPFPMHACPPSAPESGPNMGCVHSTSTSRGSWRSSRRLGNSFTLSTSTNRVERRSRCTGSEASTCTGARGGMGRGVERGRVRGARAVCLLSSPWGQCISLPPTRQVQNRLLAAATAAAPTHTHLLQGED